MGESGSGKTMTCLSLMRLVPRPGHASLTAKFGSATRTCWNCLNRK
ncbi:MAG: hypothetical protein O2909_11155, partial [Chloroflexi bacterium]|nr:hypothetical protein [Chloroflexota bacterium]